jgi:hypothetical protein
MLNKFKQDQLGRQLGIRRGLAGSIASMGTKGQQMFAEKDLKAKDLMALDAIKAGFQSGVMDRNMMDQIMKGLKKRGVKTE